MSIVSPEIEIVERSGSSLRYLEHGWPTNLCRWHAHEEYELHLLIQSSGKTLIGDYIGRFEPGQLFLVGSMLPHNWVTTSKGNPTIEIRDMLVQFSRSSFMDAAKVMPEFSEFIPLLDMSAKGIEFVGFDPGEAQGRLASIRDATGTQQLVNFLSLLIRLQHWPTKRTLSSMRFSPKGNSDVLDRIGKVVDYVSNNFDKQLDLKSMARIAGMSAKKFSNQFRLQTGNRFKDFLNRLRVGQACVLLHESQHKVSSVSREVGYHNLANFNRNFLRIVGMTPSEFRHARNLAVSPTRYSEKEPN